MKLKQFEFTALDPSEIRRDGKILAPSWAAAGHFLEKELEGWEIVTLSSLETDDVLCAVEPGVA